MTFEGTKHFAAGKEGKVVSSDQYQPGKRTAPKLLREKKKSRK
jgi:hypothetical protein